MAHQGAGEVAVEVGLQRGLVGEGVEQAERRLVDAEAEPGHGALLGLDQGQPAGEERGHLVRHARGGVQRRHEADRDHVRSCRRAGIRRHPRREYRDRRSDIADYSGNGVIMPCADESALRTGVPALG
ncbi:hypothetical protein ACFQZ4_01010 [Catellatospora coxensis]